jgi:hypothetical protein
MLLLLLLLLLLFCCYLSVQSPGAASLKACG